MEKPVVDSHCQWSWPSEIHMNIALTAANTCFDTEESSTSILSKTHAGAIDYFIMTIQDS